MRPSITCLVAAVSSVSLCPAHALGADSDIKEALHRAAGYLIERQNPDGGYGPFGVEGARIQDSSDVGITALVLTAFARHPRRYRPVDGPFVSRAVDKLLSTQQPDGGFYDPRDPVLKNYRTCVAIMALSELDPKLYAEPIARGRKYVESLQLDESKGYQADEHLSYGAFGYGGSSFRGDLSNSAMSADALKVSGTSASSPVWRRLEVFASRCQNTPKIDPLLKREGFTTTSDWGFRYGPTETRGPTDSIDGERVFRSYGSMTYQGLKTMLYAGVDRADPRVVGAFNWISSRFTVRENPGMATPAQPDAGKQGLFYYYHTMAKALSAYGEPIITDAKGVEHDWARELSAHLISIQHLDGYWVNESDRWWENIPELDTAFAMIALTWCLEEIERRERESAAEGSSGAGEGAK